MSRLFHVSSNLHKNVITKIFFYTINSVSFFLHSFPLFFPNWCKTLLAEIVSWSSQITINTLNTTPYTQQYLLTASNEVLNCHLTFLLFGSLNLSCSCYLLLLFPAIGIIVKQMFEQKQTLGEVEPTLSTFGDRIRLFTSKHLFDYITIKDYAFTNA